MSSLNIALFAIQFIVAFLATLFYSKYKNTELKWFLVLFWYIALNDIIALKYWEWTGKTNNIFYNFYYLITVSVFLYILIKNIINPLRKKMVIVLLMIIFLTFGVNFFLVNSLHEHFSIFYFVKTIIAVIAILYYLIDLLSRAEVYNATKDLLLWISSGFLVFYISFSIILATEYLYNETTTSLAKNLFNLQLIAGITCYAIISFGFIWSDKRS